MSSGVATSNNLGSIISPSSWTNGTLQKTTTSTRNIEIIRPMNDPNSFDFTDFLTCSNGFGTSLNAISAVGNAQTIAYHDTNRGFTDLVNNCCTSSPTTNNPTTYVCIFYYCFSNNQFLYKK